MQSIKQHTIASPISTSGIALHTGNRVSLRLMPAEINSGICFRRIDLPNCPEVQAHASNVTGTNRGTTIQDGDAIVHTVEHLLAAFYCMGIDNALVEMSGPEPPVEDGSSKKFVDMIESVGIVTQDADCKIIKISQPVCFESGGTCVVAMPDDKYRISCTVKYDVSSLDCQYQAFEVTKENFCNEICEARTFCLSSEIEFLMKENLIKGGSLDNAVLIHGNSILSKEGLRYPDEFVRHKMLDIIGDLFLLGCRLQAHIIAIKPGHPANVALAQKILKLEDENNE